MEAVSRPATALLPGYLVTVSFQVKRGVSVKKYVLGAIGVLAALAIAAVTAWAARAADPSVVQISTQVVHAEGFGHFSGDVRKIPRGNKVVGDDEARPGPHEPDDAPPGRAASDPALQGT